MVKPPFLCPNDTVAIFGAAGKVNKETILEAAKIIRSWQLNVIVGEHLFDDHFRFSATVENRLADFQKGLNDPKVKAIFLARGGYGSAQLIDMIDWSGFKNSPKWLIGFSDITALLMHSLTLNTMSVHGAMPIQFSTPKFQTSVSQLRSLLFGDDVKLSSPKNEFNITGRAEGRLVGGNLSILTSLIGTSTDSSYASHILFIEEISEPLYKIDRMFLQLARSGKLNKIKGLVVGKFTNTTDDVENPFGKSLEEIILQYIPLKTPVAFGAPVGHEKENVPVILGERYLMEVDHQGLLLQVSRK